MIDRLLRNIRGALSLLFLRPAVYKIGRDVQVLAGKVDMLLGAGKTNEASIRDVYLSLAMLSREMGEQHETLADRFLEGVLDNRKALETLAREMGEQHETLVDRFLEGTVEMRRALDALTLTLNQQQEALRKALADNAGRMSRSLDTLAGSINQQQEGLTADIAESTGKMRQAFDFLTETLNGQQNDLTGRIMESAGDARRAFDTLRETLDGQQSILTDRIAESTGEMRQSFDTLTSSVARHSAVLAGRILESAGETRQALAIAIATSGELIPIHMTTFMRKIEALERTSFRQYEALAALSRILKIRHPLPATRGWAASPDLLLYLHAFILDKKPAVIVELGGGVSSLVMAAALKANGNGHLFSFDHDAEYAAKTTALLARESFADIATVVHAPLSQWLPPTPNGLADSWKWYTLPKNSPAMGAVDLLVVDGPPERTGPYARYPALPALAGWLAPEVTILLDDTVREAETTIAEAWRSEFGFDLTLLTDFEKGLAIMTRKPKATRKRKY